MAAMRSWDAAPDQPVVVGLRDDIREILVTHSLDSNPQHKDEDPGPSIWPFLASLAVSERFVGSIFTPWAMPVGSPLGNHHPDRMVVAARTLADPHAARGNHGVLKPIRPLTLDVSGFAQRRLRPHNTTWLANVFYMTIEGTMFALMFASYFYLRTRVQHWPPGHLAPAFTYGLANADRSLSYIVVPARLAQKVRLPATDAP